MLDGVLFIEDFRKWPFLDSDVLTVSLLPADTSTSIDINYKFFLPFCAPFVIASWLGSQISLDLLSIAVGRSEMNILVFLCIVCALAIGGKYCPG